jgi:CcmD family protein
MTMSGEALTVLAYAVVWAVLTLYVALIARRLSRLEGEIRTLKTAQEPSRSSSPSPPPAPAATP